MSEYLILHFKIPEYQSVELTAIISNEVIDIYHSKNQPDNGTTGNNTTYTDCTKYSFNETSETLTPVLHAPHVNININIDTAPVAAST